MASHQEVRGGEIVSSKRHVRKSQCGKKIKFKKYADAIEACHAYKRKFGLTENVKVYHCKFCDYYHFGHQNEATK